MASAGTRTEHEGPYHTWHQRRPIQKTCTSTVEASRALGTGSWIILVVGVGTRGIRFGWGLCCTCNRLCGWWWKMVLLAMSR
jgi:hypothetical protein